MDSQIHRWSAKFTLFIAIGVALIATALIAVLRPLGVAPDLLPDIGASWYYWKLPDPSVLSRLTAWSGYLLHQFFMWGLIFYAQRMALNYTSRLQRINIIALTGSLMFVAIHWLQTAVYYDGLAQDVSVFSSQASVIILLIMVLVMENNRRGLFWGKSIPMLNSPGRVFRRYHGYIFSWATIYTFWFHPMESSVGHLIGFLYTFLIMIQGSLMFTRVHSNRYWNVTLEVFVLFHGTLVALMLGQEVWPMFLFGFAGLFVITQMHGLGLKPWQRWAFLTFYIGGVLWVYSSRGFDNVNEIVRIPVIEYFLVFVFASVTWLTMKLVALFKGTHDTQIGNHT